MIIYDISPPISLDLVVWPGDTCVSQKMLLDINQGDNITLSTINASVHLGAHADAPKHYVADALSIGECEITNYIGKCQLLNVDVKLHTRVSINHINTEIIAERILIRTSTFPNPQMWNDDFAALDPDLVDYLCKLGVKLIGIDTPSVDLYDSKDLPAHKRFYYNNMAMLEGLVLTSVPEGIYELIALPLRLIGFEASPVRAILRKN